MGMLDMIMWSSSDNCKETSASVKGIHGPCVGKLVSIFSKFAKIITS
jgi:hypothetical protein